MGRIAIPVAIFLIVSATHVLGIITSFEAEWATRENKRLDRTLHEARLETSRSGLWNGQAGGPRRWRPSDPDGAA